MKQIKSMYRRLRRRVFALAHRPSPERFSELDIIHDFLRSGGSDSVMLDVGAQFGESFTPFADDGWRVIAFEPDPNPDKHASLNPKLGPRVTLLRMALSDSEKDDVTFFTSEESTGISALAAFRDTHKATAKVKVSTLSKQLAGQAVSKVDFLKIDTEGFDYFVLQGYPWERKEVLPKVILCEFEDVKTRPLGYTWKQMADYLKSKGYYVFVSEWHPIEKYGISHRWRSVSRYPAELHDQNGWGNLIAISSAHEADRFEQTLNKYKHV